VTAADAEEREGETDSRAAAGSARTGSARPGVAHKAGPGPWTVRLSIALLCLIWGSTYLVIAEGLEDLPPFLSAGVRFSLAAVVFAALAPRLARREGGERPTLGLVLAMGVCNIGCGYGLVYWSETRLPSGLVSVLWAIFPLMMALAAHRWLPSERVNRRQYAGFLVGFGGVVALFLTDVRTLGPEAVPAAALLLLSPLSYAVGTTAIKRHGEHTSSVYLNRNGMAVGAAVLLSLSLLFERGAEVRWTPSAVGSILFLALVGTVVTFGLYFWLMRYAPAYLLSLIAYVTPALALLEGATLADEPVTANTWLGTGLVLAGVGIVRLGR